MRTASDATMWEKREWPCTKIVVLTSRCVHDSAMRTRSWPHAAVQSASQAWAVSSAIRLETDAGRPSASEASRTNARTSSSRAGSSTSCSSEKPGGMGTLTAGNPHEFVASRQTDPPISANPHTNFELDGGPMSALGQKQRYAVQKGRSALPQ